MHSSLDILTFKYSASDLIQPLQSLIAKLADEIATADSQLALLDPGGRQQHSALSHEREELVRLRRHRENAAAKRLDAVLWLAECNRTPLAKWGLDIENLRWLFPGESTKP